MKTPVRRRIMVRPTCKGPESQALHWPSRGCGGIGRRARFRAVWGQPRGGSSPLIRIAVLHGSDTDSVPKRTKDELLTVAISLNLSDGVVLAADRRSTAARGAR